MATYIVLNGYRFPSIGLSVGVDIAYFAFPGTENFNDIRDAFFNNSGNIEIYDEDVLRTSLEGFNICSDIHYNIEGKFSVTVSTEYNDIQSLQILTDGVRPTIKEAQEYRNKVEQIAENVTDKEESLDNIWAFPTWTEGILYTVGKRVKENEQLYKVIQEHTSQAGWNPSAARALFAPVADPTEEWPYWTQPLGSFDAYPYGAKVSYFNQTSGILCYWISDVDNNTWEPGVYGWTLDHQYEPIPEPEPTDDYPEWTQPVGSGDAYKAGDKVSHNNVHWISDVDGNVWEPGVYGWTLEEE